MPELKLGSATASDLTNIVKDIVVDPMSTDGVGEQTITEYMNSNWSQQWGYFNQVPDLKSALLMKAMWDVGNGFETDEETKQVLRDIKGWGKDSFQDIIFNMEVVKRIGGDAFAEIIRSPDDLHVINLKPLDPGVMNIVVNKQGIIIRYEQKSKLPKQPPKIFQPEEIFHLSHNRIADQIHGISDIDAVEKTILAEFENFDDMKKIMHRQAKPMIMFKLGTDNVTDINAFVKKMDEATNKGENIYIPDDKNSVEFEVVQVNVSSLIFDWRNDIRNKFYRTIGLPQIVPGASGQSTESESKAILAAYEVLVEMEQKKLEVQILSQLGYELDFKPPGIMGDSLEQDEAKDANAATTVAQPADTQVGVGR